MCFKYKKYNQQRLSARNPKDLSRNKTCKTRTSKMANVDYNFVDLDMRHNHQNEMYYEPNIPFYTQVYTPQIQQIERTYFSIWNFPSVKGWSQIWDEFAIIIIRSILLVLISSKNPVDYCTNRTTCPLFWVDYLCQPPKNNEIIMKMYSVLYYPIERTKRKSNSVYIQFHFVNRSDRFIEIQVHRYEITEIVFIVYTN